MDYTNGVRTGFDLEPLARSTSLDQFGETAARADGIANSAHAYYISTNGAGVSLAENEVLRWSLTQYGSVQGVIRAANEQFRNEGPGGPHYQDIAGSFTQTGCGFYIDGDSLTLTFEFR